MGEVFPDVGTPKYNALIKEVFFEKKDDFDATGKMSCKMPMNLCSI
jgi:hypothetical protein